MKTYSIRPKDVKRKWLLIDASGVSIGRLAAKVATLLQGKHKPEYTPHINTGDAVIVVNAASIGATGNKEQDKVYYKHSGYPGGIKAITLSDLRKKDPTLIVESAVKRMLPKGPLGREMFSNLRIYAGAEHQQTAQQPEEVAV